MKPNTETALGAALKSAVQSLSKKKQTEMIADHIYGKFDVFRQFRPLALGIHESLIASLSQFDPNLISRVVANHCRKPRYLKSLARGGKRFDLAGKPQGEVSAEEKRAAELQMQPKNATAAEADPQTAPTDAAPAAVEAAPQQEGQAES
ncbi:ProQ/FINO family protein [Chromobacterium phragmitis]|uniref:ProQ/FINO family protein n=1 Tax=Chromobacterium phragmitis TaxID=2202141 RepID=A0A344UM23_9NEIS|nr:ProQ/FINO family protein [Chromobacterium phragmitis]AXE30924.1 ProQ/FINO family protein [Chromobacterium phragmitis]AXE36321.1 ProQ/FINO family protein [Chromobacterium phragmitis]